MFARNRCESTSKRRRDRETASISTYAWITHLRTVRVDSSCSIDFTEFPFEISITKAHLANSSFFIQRFDCLFVDVSCGCDALHFATTFDVNVEHLNRTSYDDRWRSLSFSYLFFLFCFDRFGCPFVDLQRTSIETVLFL